jgi:hypothetical protein
MYFSALVEGFKKDKRVIFQSPAVITRLSHLYQAQLCRLGNCFRAIANFQFVQNMTDMRLYRILRDDQLRRSLGCSIASRQ